MADYIPSASQYNHQPHRCQFEVAKRPKTICGRTDNLYPAANGFPVLCREHHERAVQMATATTGNPTNKIRDD